MYVIVIVTHEAIEKRKAPHTRYPDDVCAAELKPHERVERGARAAVDGVRVVTHAQIQRRAQAPRAAAEDEIDPGAVLKPVVIVQVCQQFLPFRVMLARTMPYFYRAISIDLETDVRFGKF